MKPASESDDLQPEYDLKSLRLRKTGPGRKAFGMVALEPDVAAVFDSPEAVNAALRFLIKVTKDNASGIPASLVPPP